MKRIVALIALTTVLLVNEVDACSCGPINSPEEHLSRSEIVFIGIARSKKDASSSDKPFFPNTATSFEVLEALKGVSDDNIEIFHDEPELTGNCGISFSVGVKYRVFANTNSDVPYTSMCDASFPDEAGIGWPWEEYRAAVERQE